MTTQSNIDIAKQPTRLPWPPILLIVVVAVAVLLGQVLP